MCPVDFSTWACPELACQPVDRLLMEAMMSHSGTCSPERNKPVRVSLSNRMAFSASSQTKHTHTYTNTDRCAHRLVFYSLSHTHTLTNTQATRPHDKLPRESM